MYIDVGGVMNFDEYIYRLKRKITVPMRTNSVILTMQIVFFVVLYLEPFFNIWNCPWLSAIARLGSPVFFMATVFAIIDETRKNGR